MQSPNSWMWNPCLPGVRPRTSLHADAPRPGPGEGDDALDLAPRGRVQDGDGLGDLVLAFFRLRAFARPGRSNTVGTSSTRASPVIFFIAPPSKNVRPTGRSSLSGPRASSLLPAIVSPDGLNHHHSLIRYEKRPETTRTRAVYAGCNGPRKNAVGAPPCHPGRGQLYRFSEGRKFAVEALSGL